MNVEAGVEKNKMIRIQWLELSLFTNSIMKDESEFLCFLNTFDDNRIKINYFRSIKSAINYRYLSSVCR